MTVNHDDQLARERALYHYTNALESGDIDALQAILEQAQYDPMLETMIRELSEYYATELDQEPPLNLSNHIGENDHMNTTYNTTIMQPSRIPGRRDGRSWKLSPTLALVAMLTLAFAALMFINAINRAKVASGVFQTEESRNKAVFERYINEAWNGGDVSVLGELLTEDHVHSETGFADTEGVDNVADYINNFRAAVPDLHFTIEEITADGDTVWARLAATGTHSGPLLLPDSLVIPPSGNSLTLTSMAVSRFEDGKMAEITMVDDTLSLMQQLGVANETRDALIEQQNIQIGRRVIEELWNAQEPAPEAFGALYADFIDINLPHVSDTRLTTANTRHEDYFGLVRRAFPDLHITIENIVAQDDIVVVHYTLQGTFENGLPIVSDFTVDRAAPTGEEVIWTGIFIYKIEDGKITEEWWYWNNQLTFG